MKKFIEIKIISFYLLFVAGVLGFIYTFISPNLLTSSHFLNWDAKHYQWIASKGYEGFRVAFFPLFPLIWRFLAVGATGIVIFNALLFLISFYFLMKSLQLKRFETVLYLSIPSFIFFYLPYSESVFFALSVALIWSVKKKLFWLTLLSLFFCTLSRPAFTILIPALIVMELVCEKRNFQMVFRIFMYCIISLIAIAIVGLIQYQDTKKWFKFFSVQEGWGNHLQIPHFPLSSWGGNMIARLDGVAFIFGLISGVCLVLYILRVNFMKAKSIPKEVILSLAYLGGITLTVFLFRGGALFSLNRFLFATPFIIMAVNYFLKQNFSFSNRKLILILFILIIYWLSFASYVHIQAFLKYFAVSVYVVLFFMIKSEHSALRKMAIVSFISVNLFFQVYFYCHFLLSEGSSGFVG